MSACNCHIAGTQGARSAASASLRCLDLTRSSLKLRRRRGAPVSCARMGPGGVGISCAAGSCCGSVTSQFPAHAGVNPAAQRCLSRRSVGRAGKTRGREGRARWGGVGITEAKDGGFGTFWKRCLPAQQNRRVCSVRSWRRSWNKRDLLFPKTG